MAALPPPSSIDALINLQKLKITDPTNPESLTVELPPDQQQSSSSSSTHTEGMAAELQNLTELSRDMLRNKIIVPPPPKPQQNQRSTLIAKAREEGNAAFKKGNNQEAHLRYSVSLAIAQGRPLYEPAVYSKEELALALSNRAAATMALVKEGSSIPNANLEFALKDAEAVIKVKRAWPKGHFRLGKVLMEMGRLEQAKDALLFGLEFDPEEKVCFPFTCNTSSNCC